VYRDLLVCCCMVTIGCEAIEVWRFQGVEILTLVSIEVSKRRSVWVCKCVYPGVGISVEVSRSVGVSTTGEDRGIKV